MIFNEIFQNFHTGSSQWMGRVLDAQPRIWHSFHSKYTAFNIRIPQTPFCSETESLRLILHSSSTVTLFFAQAIENALRSKRNPTFSQCWWERCKTSTGKCSARENNSMECAWVCRVCLSVLECMWFNILMMLNSDWNVKIPKSWFSPSTQTLKNLNFLAVSFGNSVAWFVSRSLLMFA